MDDNMNTAQNEEHNTVPETAGNEAFADNTTDELRELYDQVKQQTAELLTELKARHAAPDGADDDAADWNAQFESYRAPFRSRKENRGTTD